MIYILEDDDSIRELLEYSLTRSGLDARGFTTPHEFGAAVAAERPTLVLLDVMLPEEDGLSVLSRLRRDPATASVPVIMLTARDSEFDKVTALDAGADDYITKPFGVMETLARVRALLRRAAPQAEPSDRLCAGDIVLSLSDRTVTSDGREISLTYKEFELLALLLENKGTVLRRDTILDRIWGYSFEGGTRTVDVHVRTLRQKLGDAGAVIETVRGVGYKINR
mgnify:FL=1